MGRNLCNLDSSETQKARPEGNGFVSQGSCFRIVALMMVLPCHRLLQRVALLEQPQCCRLDKKFISRCLLELCILLNFTMWLMSLMFDGHHCHVTRVWQLEGLSGRLQLGLSGPWSDASHCSHCSLCAVTIGLVCLWKSFAAGKWFKQLS